MAIIQVRDVEPQTLERLKELARQQDVSLSEFLRRELDRIAALPTWAEMNQRIRRHRPVNLDGVDVAAMIRADRESH